MSVRGAFWNALWVICLASSAWLLWPTALGGRAQFVIVQGSSMEPLYSSGDLLYARRTDNYEVGDVAVYSIPQGEPGADSLVVHRITSQNPDGSFTMTGDNRTTSDSSRPTTRDMVARPTANLGQLPTRLIILMPLLLSMTFGVSVAWFLWPTRPEPEAELASTP